MLVISITSPGPPSVDQAVHDAIQEIRDLTGDYST
jgi:flavin-binding protein dodecin